MSVQLEYRNAKYSDLPELAVLFLAAFPDSVQHYAGGKVSPKVMVDAFAICLDAEADAFIVSVDAGYVVGYIFAPSCFSHVQWIAIRHGHLFRLFWRWLTGQYGIGWRPVRIAISNWLTLVKEASEERLHSEARILSIAVSPRMQGHGVGTELLRRGLAYLEKLQVKRIRLEVRPDNTPAIHLYERYGFVTRGTTRDTQGPWLIMLKDMAENH